MTRYALDGMTVFIHGETFSPKGYTLIQLHVIANDTSSSYNNARPMVYCEVMSYLSLRMDVNTRFAMGHLRDDAWN